MAATGLTFPMFAQSLAQKLVDIDSDTLKAALMASYTYANTHQFWADVKGAGTESTDADYTAGGATLGSVTWALADGSRANTTAYSAGKIATPGNGHWYMVTTAGTTGGSAPTWPTTDGGTVSDGSVTWTQKGRGNAVYVLDAADVSWASTVDAAFAVVYDSTPGSDATRPVIGLINLDGAGGTVATPGIAWPLPGIVAMGML